MEKLKALRKIELQSYANLEADKAKIEIEYIEKLAEDKEEENK